MDFISHADLFRHGTDFIGNTACYPVAYVKPWSKATIVTENTRLGKVIFEEELSLFDPKA